MSASSGRRIVTVSTDFSAYLRQNDALVKAAFKQAIEQTKKRVAQLINNTTMIPEFTGALRESFVEVNQRSFSSGAAFTFYFGSYLPYLRAQDEGRKAGAKAPPSEELEAWCFAKGLGRKAAWIVAQKIGEKGYPGKHFFEPLLQRATYILQEELMKAIVFYELNLQVKL